MAEEQHDGELTGVIESARAGEGAPIDALWQAAYAELKKLARSRLSGSGPFTVLDTTALVNESYLKLAAGAGRLRVDSRGQFFAYAAKVMRSVVVDLVRERQTVRRGGGGQRVTLDTGVENLAQLLIEDDQPLRVDAALAALERVEPRLAKVVEMRYFAGLAESEIAVLLEVSERTVRRDWQKAKLLLHSMIER